MKMNKYQEQAHTCSLRQFHRQEPHIRGLLHALFGLSAESGEVSAILQKHFRGDTVELDKGKLQSELGDVLWYLAEVCTHLDLRLEQVANENLKKLRSRKKRDKLRGSGDDR